MKGPSLQHELAVLRIWKCPACGRSVRTGGEVTVRTCDCNDQAIMAYADASPVPAPDVSAFVTYMTPEYENEDDDGTDLPLPDLESLVIAAPEPRSPRNRPGRPLRETITESTPPDEDQAFGEGLDEIEPESTSAPTEGTQAVGDEPQITSPRSDEKSSRKRRPRRRRRRGGRSDRTSASDRDASVVADQADTAGSAADSTSGSSSQDSYGITQTPRSPKQPNKSGHPDGESASSDTDDGAPAPRKRRRRRRRGPRKRKNPESSPDRSDSGSTTSDGTDS